MDKRTLIVILTLATSAIAMTALAQVDTASTSTLPEEIATTTEATATATSTTTNSASPRDREERFASSTAPTPTETTIEAPSEETTTSATTTPESVPVAQEEPATETLAATAEDIPTFEESYFSKHGKYLQILPGNQLPDYEIGTVSGKLGTNVDSGVRVDVYVSPHGQGYQVTHEENGTIYTVGFGPEASDRTHSYSIQTAAASSTESN